jgi:ABC-2 type transport system ATP-binding protein
MKLDLRKKVRAYSTGMKQKLALALAFADPVDILILDEPTSALDPSARAEVLRLVKDARAQGQTVIFSGHVLPEVEAVSDRVAILRLGKLMHVENMHSRRHLRMLLIRFAGDVPENFDPELGLTLRERNGPTCLLEHRGAIGPLLSWLSLAHVEDVAIGTEDLHSLYDRFHGPDVVDGQDEAAP